MIVRGQIEQHLAMWSQEVIAVERVGSLKRYSIRIIRYTMITQHSPRIQVLQSAAQEENGRNGHHYVRNGPDLLCRGRLQAVVRRSLITT